MQDLTPEARQRIEQVAHRYGASTDTAMTLMQALIAGGGSMAQFSHPDLGGMGQWSKSGMTMVGDMFDDLLKAKVDGLCTELADLLATQVGDHGQLGGALQTQRQGGARGFAEASLFIPEPSGSAGNWWGVDLGQASSKGAQNDIRYAYFPAPHRLAIEVGGRMTFYDTADHQIAGVSQQQSGDASLTFTSQHGLVRVSDLKVVPAEPAGPRSETRTAPEPSTGLDDAHHQTSVQLANQPPTLVSSLVEKARSPSAQPTLAAKATSNLSEDPLLLIECLVALRAKDILSEEEFSSKKAELLARL